MNSKSERKSSFLDRTLSVLQKSAMHNVIKAWDEITGTARAITGTIDPELPKQDTERLLKLMNDCLHHKGGEVSSRRKTVELGHTYLSLTEKGKERFLKILATEFDVDRSRLKDKIQQCLIVKDEPSQVKSLLELRDILEPDRMKILCQFNGLPQGIKFLVDMRADLLRFKKQDSALNALEVDLRKLLAAWFDVGLLDMQEISWSSPAALLEKLIAYEAVHAISSWADLKNRLDSDRRCFAFFHHKMPTEPLIFVEVALVNGMADNIQVLLDETTPAVEVAKADTAIFYSISNAQSGLAGISFGNFLIKRVVDRLSAELPHIRNHVTLSPVPGFRTWLDPQLKAGNEALLTAAEAKAVLGLWPAERNAATALEHILATEWHVQPKTTEVIKKVLMRLVSHYLLEQKKNEKALDPVANFHLTNGAQMERLNWLADVSKKGMKQAAGIMVNYYYQLSKIEDNHEYYSSGKGIPASGSVKSWLKK